MAPRKTIEDKVGEWQSAFDAITEVIVPPEVRDVLNTMKAAAPKDDDGNPVIDAGMLATTERLARLVAANYRAAAIAAALMVGAGGARPIVADLGLDENEGATA